MHDKIPVTVLITTLNEERNLARCLSALEQFDEIIVIDSNSTDSTQEIAESFGVQVVPFTWGGTYPKKRQWCLDYLSLKHDRVFFVDADEELTPALCDEISALDWKAAGYFVKGAYSIDGKVLRFGLKNNKLCLFDRRLIEFPVVDDLDISGMGEIEGHYQPVLKTGVDENIGQLKNCLIHHALDDLQRYICRHQDYGQWKKMMDQKAAHPQDPQFLRQQIKILFSKIPAKRLLFFFYYDFFKMGVFEYPRNYEVFRQKLMYYEGKREKKG